MSLGRYTVLGRSGNQGTATKWAVRVQMGQCHRREGTLSCFYYPIFASSLTLVLQVAVDTVFVQITDFIG